MPENNNGGKGDQIQRTGWASRLAALGLFVLLFEAISGLAITFAPFHPAIEWSVLIHTLVGVITLLPVAWYLLIHWQDYKSYKLSNVVLLGYVATVALLVCAISGVVVTWQGLFAVRMSNLWRQVHLISTFVTLVAVLPHLVIVLVRVKKPEVRRAARRFVLQGSGATLLALAVVMVLPGGYSGTEYSDAFPDDYEYLYGEDRPFAPSLARTASGGAYDSRRLSGSESCGTSGCHSEILAEWKPSAHRYAAMDAAFQKIQSIMAEQNGSESTRYCGGCHDPISLFSGTKNIGVEDLTNLHGYQEGVSCLACHAIRETDLQGNANYVVAKPAEYLWQWSDTGLRRVLRDFLIRTYPDEHNKLSKRAYKTPEYCAACHKQFIDQEVNRVGWVQLQNQYDNWKASHWHVEGDPEKTVECRECHMPLVTSNDPASGDRADYNRSAEDGKHRSHRFIASNGMMPAILKLEGWEKQAELTEQWLQGKYEIPEIAHKWSRGPIVTIAVDTPEQVRSGETFDVRIVLTSNKVGHDFPTGPLDIIQSWVELHVVDEAGNTVFATGRRDEKNFIEPGSFLFKVEPVDQYGNLIDRHNLWEMVGVRFRRALFPGYSDSVDFSVACPAELPEPSDQPVLTAEERAKSVKAYEISPAEPGTYKVTAILNYRKVDQFLLNYMFGEESGLTAPVIELSRDEATVRVVPTVAATEPSADARKVGG
jgi:hypothetical protein